VVAGAGNPMVEAEHAGLFDESRALSTPRGRKESVL
jgi:hypothetical protein